VTGNCVIVGAGQCGGQAAASLRELGYAGRIVLVGAESHPPYQRPPLSKRYLAGQLAAERTWLRPSAWYAEHGIETRLGSAATAIDRTAARVELADGSSIAYDRLLLATGSRPRPLAVPGAGLQNVFTLRGLDDAQRIRAAMAPGKRLVVIGGGYIGLEVASVAVELGLHVTVLEAADRLLARVTSPPVSAYFEQLHRDRGVQIACGSPVTALEGDGRVSAVTCGAARHPADVVVAGIGIVPNTELASAAGIVCDDGILVNERLATSAPNIYAAGDCARHPCPLLGRRVRLESVQNAVDQAKAAAASICGVERPYDEVPWFWSHQYDVRLQSVGLRQEGETMVERGSPADHRFAVFYLRDGVLTGVDAVNMTREYMACRKLVAQRARLPVEQLADPAAPLAEAA
jgi:3-phenylpropionate/trans-cinnamate dioxygenase ferredoxin reductase subunit